MGSSSFGGILSSINIIKDIREEIKRKRVEVIHPFHFKTLYVYEKYRKMLEDEKKILIEEPKAEVKKAGKDVLEMTKLAG